MECAVQAARTPDDSSRAPVRIGPVRVCAGAADVADFRRETGAPEGSNLPFTYPVRWLTYPEIRAAGAALIDMDGWVPIHESQSFEYERRLDMEIDYQMMVELVRETDPSRLILRAEIGDAQLCLRMEMILRIIRTDGVESSA